MKRVTGFGGIFFKAKDANVLNEWYKRHLGFEQAGNEGAVFEWRKADATEEKLYSMGSF